MHWLIWVLGAITLLMLMSAGINAVYEFAENRISTAVLAISQEHPDEALLTLDGTSQQLGYLFGRGKMVDHVLWIANRQKGNYDEALQYLERQINRMRNDPHEFVGLQISKGNILRDAGRTQESLEVLERAKDAAGELADPESRNFSLSRVWNSLRVTYFALNRVDDALAAQAKLLEYDPDFFDDTTEAP